MQVKFSDFGLDNYAVLCKILRQRKSDCNSKKRPTQQIKHSEWIRKKRALKANYEFSLKFAEYTHSRILFCFDF